VIIKTPGGLSGLLGESPMRLLSEMLPAACSLLQVCFEVNSLIDAAMAS
jgi:hypothetical protein